MLLIVSLFLICAVVAPSIGEVVRRRNLAVARRRQLLALLRDGEVADYRLEDRLDER